MPTTLAGHAYGTMRDSPEPQHRAAKATARASLLLAFLQRYAIVLIRLVSLIVLSRLIAPAELGRFVAASAIVAIPQALADCGLTQYLIQARTLNATTERTALGIAMLTAWPMAVALWAAAMAAPSSLLTDDLRPAVAALTLLLILTPANTVSTAMLQREMRFRELAWIVITAASLAALATITLALIGFGSMSLVWGAVIESAVVTLCVWQKHTPAAPALRDWRAILGFGWVWSLVGAVKQTGEQVVRLAVGALLGYGAVGLLARAQNVLLMFDKLLLDALALVLLPALSERLRSGGEIRPMHRRMLAYLSVTAWPFFGLLALIADPLVRVLLGPQWLAAITPIRILCLGGLMIPFSGLALQFLIALGLLRPFLPFHAAIQAIKIAAAFAGSQISLDAACLALITEPLLKGLVTQHLLNRAFATSWRDLAAPLGRSAAAGIVTVSGAALCVLLLPESLPPLLTLIAVAATAAPLWAASIYLTHHPILDEMTTLAAFVRTASWRWRSPA